LAFEFLSQPRMEKPNEERTVAVNHTYNTTSDGTKVLFEMPGSCAYTCASPSDLRKRAEWLRVC
jgi:hypothetical protein